MNSTIIHSKNVGMSDQKLEVIDPGRGRGCSVHVSGSQARGVIDLDVAGIEKLIDALIDAKTPKPQKFTVTIEVPVHADEVNVFEVKNHVRKYVAEKAGVNVCDVDGKVFNA